MDMLFSDSDWESYSESCSMEDQEEPDFLYGGQAQSILSSLEESIGKIDDFLSFERGFLHGDMVCLLTDPSGQMGRVIGIDMIVDLENSHGKIIKDVNSKDLLKIRSISVGDYVVCGPWLGRVDKVVDHVSIVFDDGTRYAVNALDQENILPISQNILEDPQYPYYPGQRVRVKLSTVSKSTRWLCGPWRENIDKGTVCAVEPGLVHVDWLASVFNGCVLDLPTPPRVLDSKELTLLSCFMHENWQLGDWCILSFSDRKSIVEQAFDSTYSELFEHKKFKTGCRRTNSMSNLQEIYVIVKTKTKVDVVWQDGTITLGQDSHTLHPVNVVNVHEFWPEQFVLEKGTNDDPCQKWGVVQAVDAKEHTVRVQWKAITAPETNVLNGEKMVETVSAYELVEHPDYSYGFGDFVSRFMETNLGDHAANNYLNTETSLDEEGGIGGESCRNYKNEFSDKRYLSCIGCVTGFKDGTVEVRWATGITSKVAPYEIFRIGKQEGSITVSVEDSDNLNQEVIEDNKQTSSEKGKDLLDSNSTGEDCKKYARESASSFLPQAAIGFFTSIAASLLGSFGSSSLSASVPFVDISKVGNESGISNQIEVLESGDLCTELHTMTKQDIVGQKRSSQECREASRCKDLPLSIAKDNPYKFRQFDMIANCSDHHFLGSSKNLLLSQVQRSWLKKVHQEWSILEENLPDTIYARVFEERMDLLRAVIVGAPGTPYHDGLFFFDIFLPPDYPHEPPMVHYKSGGLRVNPNLYESGKVCLSLLNTWAGTGTEVWNPGGSTILQVLLSLQALVLNDKPYFNEAGYDQQMGREEGEKNSVSYNENAFLLTCKSILYLLRNPPEHFEALVEEHFSQRSQCILMACKAYMEGAPVGCAVGCSKIENKCQKGSSEGFKIMLAKLFPKLVEAFSDKGINCSRFTCPEK